MLAAGHLAMVGSGALDIPSIIGTTAAILVRGLHVSGFPGLRISDRVATLMAILYVAFYPLDYAYLSKDFLTATVHLVCFLTSMMVLRARTRRDYFFVQLIAFLELLTASVLSIASNFFVFLLLFLLGAAAAMSSGEIRTNLGRPQIVARASMRGFSLRLAGLIVFLFSGILIVTTGLFFFLPRTARAAFQHLASERFHLPGFSNEVVLGQIGEIRKSGTPVMHTRFHSVERPRVVLWRGAALSRFDGRRWYNEQDRVEPLTVERGQARLATIPQQWRKGRRIFYEVQLTAVTSDTLFFVGTPEFVNIEVPYLLRSSTGAYRAGTGLARGLRYVAYSFLEDASASDNTEAGELSESARARYTELPPLDRRIGELARRITANADTPSGKAAAVQDYLRSTYPYTDELPETTPADPLADFLFDRRKGHCEYFASAMAVMLRSVGVPSRVVTGFQGGVYNPISKWNLVRASDAHSWVEVFAPRRGWLGFDPTPPDPTPESATLWSRFLFYMDAAEVFWQDWVMSYDLERQLLLADRMGHSSRSFSTEWQMRFVAVRNFAARQFEIFRAKALWPLAAIAASALLVRLVWPRWRRAFLHRRSLESVQRGRARAGDATLLYERLLELLSRRGYEKPPWVTPLEFLAQLPETANSPALRELTLAYNALRFGGSQQGAPRILELLQQIEQRGAG